MCLTLCANDGDEASHSVTSAKPTILIRISTSFRVGERRDCRSISSRIFEAIRGDSIVASEPTNLSDLLRLDRDALLQRAPRFGVLTDQRLQVQGHILRGESLVQHGDGGLQLVRIRLDAIILNQPVLVRDAEGIEK